MFIRIHTEPEPEPEPEPETETETQTEDRDNRERSREDYFRDAVVAAVEERDRFYADELTTAAKSACAKIWGV